MKRYPLRNEIILYYFLTSKKFVNFLDAKYFIAINAGRNNYGKQNQWCEYIFYLLDMPILK